MTISRLVPPLLALVLAAVHARAAEPTPWGQRDPSFSFQFGNDFDTHQRTREARDGSLSGFLYVSFTGVVTQDGYPVATHVDCNMSANCAVGWRIDGRPARATFVHHPMHDHPVFMLPRADIPQPGSYSHFHWTGPLVEQADPPADGYMLQLTAMNRFCFIHHDVMAMAATSAANCRDNGGVRVDRGVDIATHLNIVTAPSHHE